MKFLLFSKGCSFQLFPIFYRKLNNKIEDCFFKEIYVSKDYGCLAFNNISKAHAKIAMIHRESKIFKNRTNFIVNYIPKLLNC